MAANKNMRFGPAVLAAAVANILNPAVTSMAGPVGIVISQPYLLIRALFATNKTALAATYTLYIGAAGGSAAGTEFAVSVVVPANTTAVIPLPGAGLRLDAADFLTGLASAAATIVLTGIVEVGISG